MSKTCCFIGHSPKLLGGYDTKNPTMLYVKKELKNYILDLVINKNVSKFITGMSLGVDHLAVDEIVKLRVSNPYIELVAALPYVHYEQKWPKPSQLKYSELISHCDDKVYVSTTPSAMALFERNIWMIDNSDIVLAVWNGLPNCNIGKYITYAKKNKKEVEIISTGSQLELDLQEG